MKKIYLVPALLTLLSSCSWWGKEEITLSKEQRKPVNITDQDVAQLQPPLYTGNGMPPQMGGMNDYQMPQGMSAPQMPPMGGGYQQQQFMQAQMPPMQQAPMQGGFMEMPQNASYQMPTMEQMQQSQFAPPPQNFMQAPQQPAKPGYNYNPWQQQSQLPEMPPMPAGSWDANAAYDRADAIRQLAPKQSAPVSLHETYTNPLNQPQRIGGFPQVIPAPPREQLYRFDPARQSYVPAN